MSFGAGIGQAFESLMIAGLTLIVVLPVLAFTAGWWLGDRFDLPAVRVEFGP